MEYRLTSGCSTQGADAGESRSVGYGVPVPPLLSYPLPHTARTVHGPGSAPSVGHAASPHRTHAAWSCRGLDPAACARCALCSRAGHSRARHTGLMERWAFGLQGAGKEAGTDGFTAHRAPPGLLLSQRMPSTKSACEEKARRYPSGDSSASVVPAYSLQPKRARHDQIRSPLPSQRHVRPAPHADIREPGVLRGQRTGWSARRLPTRLGR